MAQADRLYSEGVTLLESNYPDSAALLSAKARIRRLSRTQWPARDRRAMFREIVHSQPDTSNLPPSFASVLRPYVDLLLKKTNDPSATAEIFATTQLMVRPGLAQTQAIFARELSGGTDEASRLFRQSVTLTRQAESARIELGRLNEISSPTQDDAMREAASSVSRPVAKGAARYPKRRSQAFRDTARCPTRLSSSPTFRRSFIRVRPITE